MKRIAKMIRDQQPVWISLWVLVLIECVARRLAQLISSLFCLASSHSSIGFLDFWRRQEAADHTLSRPSRSNENKLISSRDLPVWASSAAISPMALENLK